MHRNGLPQKHFYLSQSPTLGVVVTLQEAHLGSQDYGLGHSHLPLSLPLLLLPFFFIVFCPTSTATLVTLLKAPVSQEAHIAILHNGRSGTINRLLCSSKSCLCLFRNLKLLIHFFHFNIDYCCPCGTFLTKPYLFIKGSNFGRCAVSELMFLIKGFSFVKCLFTPM